MIGGIAAAFAAWSYLEASLASGASSSFSFGLQIMLLGFVGGAAAYLAKVPLIFRLADFEARRAALLASSLMALAAFLLYETGLELGSYLFLSASYGVAYAAIFVFLLYDVSHDKWRETISAMFAISFALSSALLMWNPRGSAHLLAIVAALLLALSSLAAQRALIPSLWVKSIEIFSDIMAFRRKPDIDLSEEITRTSILLGSAAALKVALLSGDGSHGTLWLSLYALGSSFGAALSYLNHSPRLTVIMAVIALSSIYAFGDVTVALLLIGLIMAHGQLSVILTVLEMRPRDAPRAMALVSAAVAVGSAITGLISSASAEGALKISMILSLLALLFAAIRSKRSWDR